MMMMCPPKTDQETLFVASRCFASGTFPPSPSTTDNYESPDEDEDSDYDKSPESQVESSEVLTRASVSVPADLSKMAEQEEIVHLNGHEKRTAYKRVRSSLDDLCESICQDLSNIQVLKRQRVKISDLSPSLLEGSIFEPRRGGGFREICVDLKKTHPRIAALKKCPI